MKIDYALGEQLLTPEFTEARKLLVAISNRYSKLNPAEVLQPYVLQNPFSSLDHYLNNLAQTIQSTIRLAEHGSLRASDVHPTFTTAMGYLNRPLAAAELNDQLAELVPDPEERKQVEKAFEAIKQFQQRFRAAIDALAVDLPAQAASKRR